MENYIEYNFYVFNYLWFLSYCEKSRIYVIVKIMGYMVLKILYKIYMYLLLKVKEGC